MPLRIALFPLADRAGGRLSLSVLWAVFEYPLRGDWGLMSAMRIGDSCRFLIDMLQFLICTGGA